MTSGGGPEHLLIGCTLRSGSNLLCDVLRSNGFGDPKEWFQPAPGIGGAARSLQSNTGLLERQARAFAAAHEAGRWRGAKFDWRQFQTLRSLAPRLDETARLLEELQRGRWIFLRRRNLADQAVSLYAAQVTGAWMGEDTPLHERVPDDFEAIHERFAALAAEEFAWEDYFRAANMTPIRLFYEDIVGWAPETWLALMSDLAPDFDPARLDLSALRPPAPQIERLSALKVWFHEQLVSGRSPRSVLDLLEQIRMTIDRLERTPGLESVLNRFVGDLLAQPAAFQLRKLDLGTELHCEGSTMLVQQDHFLDRVALRLDPLAACVFAAPSTRVLLQFHAHAWSGVAEITLAETTETLDLFSERADTRNFIRELPPGFTGPITVRCTGDKSLLSEGREVWLQRAFVLDRKPV